MFPNVPVGYVELSIWLEYQYRLLHSVRSPPGAVYSAVCSLPD